MVRPRYLLTPSELNHLQQYEANWLSRTGVCAHHDMDAFFNLQDNPEKFVSWSINGKLPAFRRSQGKVWHACSKRWLTGKEKLASLGFPVFRSMAEAAGCPLFAVDVDNDAGAMAGNAWHLHNAGLVLLAALSSVAKQWLTVTLTINARIDALVIEWVAQNFVCNYTSNNISTVRVKPLQISVIVTKPNHDCIAAMKILAFNDWLF